MAEQVQAGFWGVVYVSKGGEVLLHEGYGLSDRHTQTPMRKDTVIDAGSFSKQVTAAAAVKLASAGKLSLQDPLSKYFPTVPADKSAITIKQLLSHTGGVQEWAFPDDFVPIAKEAWLQKVFAAPLVRPVGSGYHYSNDGITLVAMIIESVSKQPYRDYIKRTFFEPLGMTHSGWYDDTVFHDPSVSVATGYRNGKDDGAPNEWPGPYWALLGNGGILWTVDDMLKWHNAVHGGLFTRGEREQLFERITADPEHRRLYPSETAPMYYGLGWRIGTSLCGDTRIGHTGTGLSHNIAYRYYRDRDLLIYAASNKLDVDYLGNETVYARDAAEALSLVFMDGCKPK
jgi:CubicO group peptidase (beta-lactamase class C family)